MAEFPQAKESRRDPEDRLEAARRALVRDMKKVKSKFNAERRELEIRSFAPRDRDEPSRH